MKLIVPMAGRGSRFAKVSDQNLAYKRPKPLIDVLGHPMVWWAVTSLPFVSIAEQKSPNELVRPDDITFIGLEEHEAAYDLTKVLQDTFGQEINVVLIPEVTRGAAETVLAAKQFIDPEADLLITDSDHYFEAQPFYEAIQARRTEVEGIIPVFQPLDNEPKWSYSLLDEDGLIIAEGEKDPELAAKGAHANIGAYYFSKGATFLNEAEQMIAEQDMVGEVGKAEFYISRIYQRLLEKNCRLAGAVIDKVWGLGTPADLELFLAAHQSV